MGEKDAVTVIPGWVVPAPQQVSDLWHLSRWVGVERGHLTAQGEWAAVDWVTDGNRPPMTGPGEAATWELARAQGWVALSRAANDTAPTDKEWAVLAVVPRPVHAVNREYAYGAWRALAWLLGVRPDPLTVLPARGPDGRRLPGTEVYSFPARPNDPVWQARQQPRRDREIAEARRWWEHVRAKVAATELSAR